MKKIDFKNIKIFMLDGTEIPEPKLHELVANSLIQAKSTSPIRNMELARKIYTEGEVELLAEDVNAVKNAVAQNTRISAIAEEAILKAIEQ